MSFEEILPEIYRKAQDLVVEKGKLGRNDEVPVPDMFPRGAKDCVTMIYMKSCRIIAEATEDKTIEEELIDILNYAAFGLTILEGERRGVL